jgi:D-glycero-alpha-D-manno-heptose 1-phosphate guanylyltransferase
MSFANLLNLQYSLNNLENLEAIILAGGLGTRLQQVISDLPKSMAQVNGRPFVEYLLNYLRGQGITKFILSVGHKKEAIETHLGSRFMNIPIEYAIEEEPLGTGGGIRNAFKLVNGDTAFVLNGDSMFRMGMSSLIQLHSDARADITIALRYLDDTERYGAVMIDNDRRIIGFTEKGGEAGPGYINGGIYLINKKYLLSDRFRDKFSIEKDCFEKYFQESRFFGFPSRGYFLDIGIPEDFYRAQHEFRPFED